MRNVTGEDSVDRVALSVGTSRSKSTVYGFRYPQDKIAENIKDPEMANWHPVILYRLHCEESSQVQKCEEVCGKWWWEHVLCAKLCSSKAVAQLYHNDRQRPNSSFGDDDVHFAGLLRVCMLFDVRHSQGRLRGGGCRKSIG